MGDERVEQGGGQARPRGTPCVARRHLGGEAHGVTRRVPQRHQPEPGGGAHLAQQRGQRRDGRGGDRVEQRGLVGEHPDGPSGATGRRPAAGDGATGRGTAPATARGARRRDRRHGGGALRRGGGGGSPATTHAGGRTATRSRCPSGRAVHRERIGARGPRRARRGRARPSPGPARRAPAPRRRPSRPPRRAVAGCPVPAPRRTTRATGTASSRTQPGPDSLAEHDVVGVREARARGRAAAPPSPRADRAR